MKTFSGGISNRISSVYLWCWKNLRAFLIKYRMRNFYWVMKNSRNTYFHCFQMQFKLPNMFWILKFNFCWYWKGWKVNFEFQRLLIWFRLTISTNFLGKSQKKKCNFLFCVLTITNSQKSYFREGFLQSFCCLRMRKNENIIHLFFRLRKKVEHTSKWSTIESKKYL